MALDSDTTSTVTPIGTATLKIRKSANEVIELPLTTQKPIARSLAVFQDGKVYYCPLVHSGEYLDSGVKIRIGYTTYALATQIYNPVTYDSSGRQWTVEGSPIHVMQNSLYFPGIDCLEMTSTVNLTSSSSFSFRCWFSFSCLANGSQTIFEVYITNAKRLYLGFQGGDLKLKLHFYSSNSTTIVKTLSAVLNVGEMYFTEVSYNNGVWAFNFDGTDLGTVSKNIPAAGDYHIRIGNNAGGGRGFNGYLYDVSLSFDNIESKLRFGN